MAAPVAQPAPAQGSKYNEHMFDNFNNYRYEDKMIPLFNAPLTPEEMETINKALDNAKKGKTLPAQSNVGRLKGLCIN